MKFWVVTLIAWKRRFPILYNDLILKILILKMCNNSWLYALYKYFDKEIEVGGDF